MSRIDELIAEHCPDGVDFKVLGEVVSPQRGRRLVRSQLEESGRFAVYQNSMKPLGYYHESNTQPGVTFVIVAGAAGEIGFSADAFWAADDVYFFPEADAVINKYLYHFLLTKQHEISSQVRRASVPRLSIAAIEKLKIPVPHLEVQREIVKVLDTFTKLEAELEAELTARKKQYNYYRDQLLSFEDGNVEWKTLGDVTKKWYSGGTPTAGNPEYYDGGDIPWLRTQEVRFSDIERTEVKITQKALEKSAAKWIPANCVIIAISGATAGRSAINKIPLTTNQHCGCLEIDSTKALYRYVFHWVSFNYENIKALGQGARGDLNSSIIKGFSLPIPYADDPEKSLAEQARIVAILDKFEALVNDLSYGLPAEIKARRQRHEHYRYRLLSFPEKVQPRQGVAHA